MEYLDACDEAKTKDEKRLEYQMERKFFSLQDKELEKEESKLKLHLKN